MLSKKVKELRKQKGWSQQKLAENADLAFNTITKIEQGLAEHPNLKTLIKLVDVLEVTIDELVGRKVGRK